MTQTASDQQRLKTLHDDFTNKFGRPVEFVSRAPGRVNLIGEHTDYNGGFVFPVAINRTVLQAVAANGNTGEIRLYSSGYDQPVVFNLSELVKASGEAGWSNYVSGVAWALQQQGLLDLAKLPGADILIESNVPQGAGLSSSAALEIATALTLFKLAGLPSDQIDRPRMALACQLAENGFVGANTGIMDQFVSSLGQADSALLVDTRSLEYRAVPLGFAGRGLKLVAVNSAVPHRHDASGYNQRRAECEQAAHFLAQAYQKDEKAQLRDFSLPQLEAVFDRMPALPAKRARHVITEDARTLKAVSLLEGGFKEPGDLARFGELLAASHRSMRDDFEITVPQVDLLVELAWQLPGVIGARMTGGGFGGCTVNVVEEAALADFEQQVVEVYRHQTGLAAQMYIFDAVEGGSLLNV